MSDEFRTAWKWVAWSANKERICDCGIALHETEAGARQIAAMCLGGPHMHEVTMFTVEKIGELRT